MSTVGRDIEEAIQSLMKISEEYATLKAKLNKATGDLSMLDTLFSVSKYISSGTEVATVLSVLEDGIKGVFGASICNVVFDDFEQHLTTAPEVYEMFSFENLSKKVSDYVFFSSVEDDDITPYRDGPVLVIRLAVGDETFGFLTILWSFSYPMSDSQLIFLRIIANQSSMYLKSARLVEIFKKQAIIDPLTGIFNRSYLSEIESTRKPQKDESVLMFDLDKFKRINDEYGHQYGDEVLKQFAQVLMKVTKELCGTAFRYGGEEFIIKIDDGGVECAFEVAETVRLRFNELTGFTVSVGISTCGYSCNVASYSALLESADESLYISKHTGRNRVTVSNSDLQILEGSASSIEKFIGMASRDFSIPSLYRLNFRNSGIISEELYEKIHQQLKTLIRLTDVVVLTPSLDAVVFLDEKINDNIFITRVEKMFKKNLSDYSYEVISMSDIATNIIQKNHSHIVVAVDFSKYLAVDDNVPIELRVLGQWYNISLIFSKHDKVIDINQRLINTYVLSQLLDYAEQNLSLDHLYFTNDLSQLSNRELPLAIRIFNLVNGYLSYIDGNEKLEVCEVTFKTFASDHSITALDLVKKFTNYIERIEYN